MASDIDVTFKLDNYMAPQKLTGADAWVHNILDTLFIEKGTYSDTPNLGINLKSLRYMDADSLVNYLQNELKEQCNLYLPNIPLDDILIGLQTRANGEIIAIITLGFSTSKGKISKSAIMSIKDDIIDFIVDNFDKVNVT